MPSLAFAEHGKKKAWFFLSFNFNDLRHLPCCTRTFLKYTRRMNYLSTRGQTPPTSIDQALLAGLAPDGGLYIPEFWPHAQPGRAAQSSSLPELAAGLLASFFAGSVLADQLTEICQRALALPIKHRQLNAGLSVLELFHGPTCAFKDFAARFLAECMSALRAHAAQTTAVTTVLVATSGDTGAAVADAFFDRPGFAVKVLYPNGRISPRQAHHLGAFGGNVQAYAVDGSFDDCQAMVKQAFADQSLRSRHPLASANSISLGRLLPQMAYYAWLADDAKAKGLAPPQLIIPSGNLGNSLAAILARHMGLALGRIVLATNANRALPAFFAGAPYQGFATIPTLANAMDVGHPSNVERLRAVFDDHSLRTMVRAESVDDAAIASAVRRCAEELGEIVCPHTACGFEVASRLSDEGPWTVVATAHPAKFPEVIEPLIGRQVEAPPQLLQVLAKPSQAQALAFTHAALCGSFEP
jgi:threonine synthase